MHNSSITVAEQWLGLKGSECIELLDAEIIQKKPEKISYSMIAYNKPAVPQPLSLGTGSAECHAPRRSSHAAGPPVSSV